MDQLQGWELILRQGKVSSLIQFEIGLLLSFCKSKRCFFFRNITVVCYNVQSEAQMVNHRQKRMPQNIR